MHNMIIFHATKFIEWTKIPHDVAFATLIKQVQLGIFTIFLIFPLSSECLRKLILLVVVQNITSSLVTKPFNIKY